MKNSILLAICGGIIYWQLFGFGGPDEVQIRSGGGFISAETGSSYFEFDQGDAVREPAMRVVSFEKTSGMLQQMGFVYSAALLRPDEYHAFEQLQASGQCPASFVTTTARQYLLMASDPAVRASLQRMVPQPGETVSFWGTALRFAMGEIRKVPLKSFTLGRAVAVDLSGFALE